MGTVTRKFRLGNRFEPSLSSHHPVLLTSGDVLFCGKDVEDSITISALSANTFALIKKISDDDKVTCFTVSTDGMNIFVALRSLFIKRIDYGSSAVKIWRSEHHRPVLRMSVNKDCTRFATGSGDTSIRLWHIGPKEGFSATLRLHKSMPTLMRFHPDSPHLFSSALGDFAVAVWDTENGTNVGSLDGHQSTVTDIAFAHSGSLLATCARDKVIMIWSHPHFTRVQVIPAFESLDSCVFLPIGALVNHLGDAVSTEELLVTGGQWGCLRIWHPTDGKCLLEIKGPLDRTPLTRAENLPTSQTRYQVDYGLHSIVSLQLVYVKSVQDACDSDCYEGTFLPKLSLVRQSNHVEFYNPLNGRLLSEYLGDIGQVDQLCVVGKLHNYLILADSSPHLKLFISPHGLNGTSVSTLRSWNCHLVPGGHSDVITDVSVSPNGEWFATSSKDLSICLWHVVDSDSIEAPPPSRPSVRVLLAERLDSAHSSHIRCICFGKSTNILISTSDDNVLKMWMVNTDHTVCSLPKGQSPRLITERSVAHGVHNASVNAIDISCNDQLVATASRDKTVKIWAIEKRVIECVGTLIGHRRGVWSVCFSAHEKTFEGQQPVYKAVFLSNERQILSCDQKGLVRIWDVSRPGPGKGEPDAYDTGRSHVIEAHDGRIWSLAVCPGETGFFTGGEDETLCYFQDVTEEVQEELTKKQDEFVQTQQLLDNLIAAKQFSRALRHAVKLDQPKQALQLLQNLLLDDAADSKTDPTKQGKLYAKLRNALDGLLTPPEGEETIEPVEFLPQRLLKYAINWNTRARTCVVAQCILNWVLTSFTPSQLMQWPEMPKTIESLKPYTARHYQRISRLEEQLAILDYFCDMADENSVLELVTANSDSVAPADGLHSSGVVDLTLDQTNA
ncbi:unnamed protein product [Dicrocoelium dendriticum]|nr:unnamed protein product [Dicrocoelium dendriticum]